ncbi:MAG: AMP-binding protein [Oscillospiraceae bacterium]
MCKSGLSVWISTPAFLEICSFADCFCSVMLPNLKKFILAGEVLTKRLVGTIWEKFEGADILNGYGPTEGTVLLSACNITKNMMEAANNLPIGKVLPDAEYWISEENGASVLPGKTGELVVVSNSISQGYYQNPEQTAKVFFHHHDGRMGYKTGDLVFEEDGFLYYVGRKDFQIKLNGFRIELEDISNNLQTIDFVSNSVVLPVYREERVSYLAAFVTLHSQPESSRIKTGVRIKKELRSKIPSYMIPRKIVILDKFPLNTNGKIDRRKLLEDL